MCIRSSLRKGDWLIEIFYKVPNTSVTYSIMFFFVSQWAFCSSSAGQLMHFRNLLGINYTMTKLKPGSGAMQYSGRQGDNKCFFVKICLLF